MCVSIALNVAAIGMAGSKCCTMLLGIVLTLMYLVFFAFLIMSAVYAYPAGAVQCMASSGAAYAGKVLWYYATINFVLWGLAICGCCFALCCGAAMLGGVAVTNKNDNEGGIEESD